MYVTRRRRKVCAFRAGRETRGWQIGAIIRFRDNQVWGIRPRGFRARSTVPIDSLNDGWLLDTIIKLVTTACFVADWLTYQELRLNQLSL